jgi:large subunit ribosomal protein L6
MARLGKTPISLPKGAEIKQTNQLISVKGPKGSLEREVPRGISIKVDDGKLYILGDEKELESKAFHGLYWSLINNMIQGVVSGYEKILSLVGVGFRAAVKGNKLELKVGFSKPRELEIPKGVQVAVDKEKGVEIMISGLDKQLVGHFAAVVRGVKKPEPYKGKGIRYKDEYVRKKAGKAAAKGPAAAAK